MNPVNANFRRRLLFILGCLVLSPFCSAQPAPQAFTPGPNSRAITYIIALTDRLRVLVFQEENLSTVQRVDSKGRISPPLAGSVEVVGLTIEQAERAVEEAFRNQRILRSPKVSITVEEYAAREVIVQGEVLAPGRISLPIESGMTVLDAITKAGGFSETAKGQAVRITRQKADGTKETITVDVKSALLGQKSSTEVDSSLLLLPDDIVYVPMSLF